MYTLLSNIEEARKYEAMEKMGIDLRHDCPSDHGLRCPDFEKCENYSMTCLQCWLLCLES